MNKLIKMTLISLSIHTASVSANDAEPLAYINKNVGFNIDGYDYNQPALPCNIDNSLVNLVVDKSNKSGINMEAVESKNKIQNGILPVVLIDIEQLVLNEAHNYGQGANSNLPNIQITAGVLKGKDIQTAKHTCTIVNTTNELVMATDKVTYNIPGGAVCAAAQKCLEDISQDVVAWLKPQIK